MKSQSVRQTALTLLYLGFGFALPFWWSFLIPAAGAGFFLDSKKSKGEALWVGALGALAWIWVAAIEDAMTGWRISSRLAGVVSAPSRLLLYIALAVIAGVLSWGACVIALRLRRLISEGLPRTD